MSERRTDDRVAGRSGDPIPADAWVEQTEVDAELGALRSRLGKRGRVLRRSATRLVVRFEGETTLTRIRPPGEMSPLTSVSVMLSAGHNHDRGQAERHVAAGHQEEHPETGRHRVEAALSGYAVIVERGDDGGYGAWSPDLPGCVAVGDSYDECVRLMREAIPLHIDNLRTYGDPISAAVGVLTIDTA